MQRIISKINFNHIFLLAILILGLDWIACPIPGTSKNIAFMGTEVLICILSIYLIRKIYKRQYEIQNGNKKIIITSLIFLIISILEIIYRTVKFEFDMQFFSITRIYIMAILMYFIFDSEIIKKKYISDVIIIAISLLNFAEISHLLINRSLRTSEIAININIYMCIALLVLPFFIFNIFNKELGIVKKIAVYFNVIAIIVLVPFSGSRMSLIVLVAICLGMIFVMRKYCTKKNIFKISMCILAAIILITLFYVFMADNYAKSSLYRSINLDKIMGFENDDLRKRNSSIETNTSLTSINKINTNNIEVNENKVNTNIMGLNENKVNTNIIESNENNKVKENKNVEMTRTSDLLRRQLWNEAIEKIKENPIVGKGIVTLNYEISGRTVEQSPHNFMLELLLSFGIVGTIAFLISVVYMLKAIYNQKIKNESKMIFIGQILVFLCFASFQPIMMSLLSVMILMYVLNINYDEFIKKIDK